MRFEIKNDTFFLDEFKVIGDLRERLLYYSYSEIEWRLAEIPSIWDVLQEWRRMTGQTNPQKHWIVTHHLGTIEFDSPHLQVSHNNAGRIASCRTTTSDRLDELGAKGLQILRFYQMLLDWDE